MVTMGVVLVSEIIVSSLVNDVLKSFSNNKMINCPVCRATIDLIAQELESESNYYFCANCGFTIEKLTINKS